MPTYQVTSPEGRTVRLTGDSPPTEQELEEIFASLPQQQQAPAQQSISTQQAPQQPQQVPVQQPAQRSSVTPLARDRPFPVQEDRETRATQELPELGQGGLLSGEDTTTVAKLAPVLLATTKPEEIGQILTSTFPHIGITQDEKGNLIAGNNKTGAQVVLNKPGLSQLDLVQGLGIAAAFTPAAKAATLPASLAGKVAAGAAGAGLTETAIQAGQEAAGGEFDKGDIALTTGLGGAAELAAPAVSAIRAAKGPIEDQTLVDALSKGTVLTTDVKPPKTFMGKAFQKVSERIPFAGTGKVRARQQVSRQEALENVAREFDIDPSSQFEKDIVASAGRVFKGAQQKAAKLRGEAIDQLNTLGDLTPVNAIREIDDQLVKIKDLGARGDTGLTETLQNIKGELTGNFERLKDIRTTIFNDIADIGSLKSPTKSGGDAVLSRVAGALSKDLDDIATTASRNAPKGSELVKSAGKWKASNRIFKDNFAKAKQTELKRVLTKGKLTPEVINSVVKGGKASELQRLHGNIDLKGRKAVRQQVLKMALEKTGFPETLNPTRFVNELERPNMKKAINVFFKGQDRRQLEGLKKFLNMTRRAQEEAASIATQQEVTTLGLIGGAAVAPKPVIGAAVLTGLTGRAYESKPVRDLLIKLSNIPPNSKKAQAIVDQLKPLLITAGRE